MDRASKAKRFAEIWLKSRAESGFSQERMAMELGVSKKTIQNWEKGLSFPNAFQVFEWFEVLNMNPIIYFLAYQHENDSDTDKKFYNYMEVIRRENKKRIIQLYEAGHGEFWDICLQCSLIFSLIDEKTRMLIMLQLLHAFEVEDIQGDTSNINIEVLENYLQKIKEETINKAY